MNEAAALPIAPGSVVPWAHAVLRPPPTPPPGTPPISGSAPVIGHVAPTATSADRRAGKGLPSSRRHPLNVPRPYAGRFLGAALPGSTPLPWPSPGLPRVRLLLLHPKAGANDAAGFASHCGPLSCSPKRAFDTGLRPDQLPGRAASLLSGPLAATRTGLTPAGDDELALDQVNSQHHPQLWAHKEQDVEAPEQNCLHRGEVARKGAVGVGAQERSPAHARPSRRRTDALILEDRPDGGGSDLHAKAMHLAADTPIPQVGFSLASRSRRSRISAPRRGLPCHAP
jgi:hypothetical protein